ncbi:unnamed protein product [Hymenolepis diminuta]|uniref:Uncharacterized protein n=1 Tax=Hymenolepis diminuta TaxID=6216 RepID=A0A564Z9J3_HYMDI|nr:unnamed protein product [Hymenolepis diminuta]
MRKRNFISGSLLTVKASRNSNFTASEMIRKFTSNEKAKSSQSSLHPDCTATSVIPITTSNNYPKSVPLRNKLGNNTVNSFLDIGVKDKEVYARRCLNDLLLVNRAHDALKSALEKERNLTNAEYSTEPMDVTSSLIPITNSQDIPNGHSQKNGEEI